AALLGVAAKIGHERSSSSTSRRRQKAPWRALVEGCEGIWKARHRAADADAASIHASAVVTKRATRHDVTLHDWTPTTEFDEALFLPIRVREFAFLVVTGTNAAPVNRRFEHPGGSPQFVELRKRSDARQKHENGSDRFRDVVADRRATGNVDGRQPECAQIVLAEQVHHRHRVGHIASGSRDASPRCTGTDRHYCGGPWRKFLQPSRGWDWSRRPVLAFFHTHGGPVPAEGAGYSLIGPRTLEQDNVRSAKLAGFRQVVRFHELLAGRHRKHGMVKNDLGKPGNGGSQELLDARILRADGGD